MEGEEMVQLHNGRLFFSICCTLMLYTDLIIRF